MSTYPERIVCLGAELPDIFHRLGALDRVVGISAFTDWPPEALSLPKVSGFRHGRARRVLSVDPDLIILTSTVQLPLAQELAGRRIPLLHVFPHRLADMFQTVRLLGNLVDRREQAEAIVREGEAILDRVARGVASLPRRPRVYFEEWMDPLVAGVGWVSDLITVAGGLDIFRERAEAGHTAAERQVAAAEVVAADPELMLVSWCGEPMDAARIRGRDGWDHITALRLGQLVELPPAILQCGPRLLDLLPDLAATIARAVA